VTATTADRKSFSYSRLAVSNMTVFWLGEAAMVVLILRKLADSLLLHNLAGNELHV
jgi:hypothetical protein